MVDPKNRLELSDMLGVQAVKINQLQIQNEILIQENKRLNDRVKTVESWLDELEKKIEAREGESR